jgi:hypothetical protein
MRKEERKQYRNLTEDHIAPLTIEKKPWLRLIPHEDFKNILL